MTTYTHPGQRATVSIQGIGYAAHDWQGNPLYECCRGRGACGRHTNYVPRVDQCARIANGPAVWQVESVDERERFVTLLTIRDNGDEVRRVVGFENVTIVSPDEYARVNALRPYLDPPIVGKCTGCQRRTWSSDEIGSVCGMRQPDGSHCSGTFQR